jgi:transcription elongation factor GreA
VNNKQHPLPSKGEVSLNGKHMTKTYYLTKEGLEKLKKECENLKMLQRNEILSEEAPSMLEGDALNPDYSFYKENLEELEKRIEELDCILKNCKIIKRPLKTEQNKISLGAKVILKKGSKEEEYKIVGTLEADPFAGRISNESPLGMSFIGKTVGESVSFNGGGEYKILKIVYEES